MTTERQAGHPSRVLAEQLRASIAGGTLSEGDRLPSERVLAARHGIARNTAREAVRLLAAQGLVTAEHGRGVFVRAKPRLLRFGRRRYARALREETGLSPFRAEVEAQGRTPSVSCTSIEEVAPPQDVADRLGLDPAQDRVIRRENWYFADEEPVQVGVTYIPLPVAGEGVLATSADLGPGSLYARFEERGHPITQIREEVTARMPDPQEARGLEIPDGVPVLDVLHTGIDDKGRPFEVTRFVMRADHNGLDYTMPVEGQ
jgi:GntR family transcriptional regulator